MMQILCRIECILGNTVVIIFFCSSTSYLHPITSYITLFQKPSQRACPCSITKYVCVHSWFELVHLDICSHFLFTLGLKRRQLHLLGALYVLISLRLYFWTKLIKIRMRFMLLRGFYLKSSSISYFLYHNCVSKIRLLKLLFLLWLRLSLRFCIQRRYLLL